MNRFPWPLLSLTLLLCAVVATPVPAQDREEPVSSWIKKLDSKYREERFKAALTLGKLGPAARTAVPALIEILQKDKDKPMRHLAADALGKIGPGASAAVLPLADTLTDPDPDLAGRSEEHTSELQ